VEKRSLLNESIRKKLMPNLNSAQILKIISMYNSSEFEGAIPQDVYDAFGNNAPALESIYSETTTIVDAKKIIPFQALSELENNELKAELPFLSFPIPIKEQINKMREEELKREQEQLVHLTATIKELPNKPIRSGSFTIGNSPPPATPRGTAPPATPRSMAPPATPRGGNMSPLPLRNPAARDSPQQNQSPQQNSEMMNKRKSFLLWRK